MPARNLLAGISWQIQAVRRHIQVVLILDNQTGAETFQTRLTSTTHDSIPITCIAKKVDAAPTTDDE